MPDMKSTIFPILYFILIAICIPLSGAPALFLTPQIGILLISCMILLASQPAISIKKSIREQKTDKLSVLGIMIGSAICIHVNVLEWAYWREEAQAFNLDGFTASGLFLIAAGIAIRLWAIRTLGKFFTSEVIVQHDQKIIQTGPYRLVRHPSYLGAYTAIIGCSFLLQTTVGLIISAIMMLAAYLYRIHVEEQTLVDEFGADYLQYQEKTARLIPFLY